MLHKAVWQEGAESFRDFFFPPRSISGGNEKKKEKGITAIELFGKKIIYAIVMQFPFAIG